MGVWGVGGGVTGGGGSAAAGGGAGGEPAARAVAGPIRPGAVVTVEPIGDGSRSRVTFELDFSAHGIGVPLLPLVRRQAAKAAPVSYRRLKQLLEAG